MRVFCEQHFTLGVFFLLKFFLTFPHNCLAIHPVEPRGFGAVQMKIIYDNWYNLLGEAREPIVQMEYFSLNISFFNYYFSQGSYTRIGYKLGFGPTRKPLGSTPSIYKSVSPQLEKIQRIFCNEE
jgi:hypothetical protein